jgi:methionyl-tRNA formyltransferase
MNIELSKFLYVSYRDWADKTYFETFLNIPRVKTNFDLMNYIKNNVSLEYIFFIGWSELISEEILKDYTCFCVHPSLLPLYRGGSPIQNQIIDGVLDSGVTLFKMNNKIDAGPIFAQKYLSLRGTLDEIFNRLSFISADMVRDLILKINNNEIIQLIEQDEKKATFYKRRTPIQSEVKIEEIETSTSVQLYNKIRSLGDPYPNAYIMCANGSKLILKSVMPE